MIYKIVSFNRVTGQIDVEYENLITMGLMLPIDSEGKVPVGDTLKDFILMLAPVAEIERLKNLKQKITKEILNADQISQLVEPSSSLKDPILDNSYSGAVLYAANYIDGRISKIRAKYITVAAGQELTYMVKAQQARDYKASGYTGPIPLYISLEAEKTNTSIQDTTDGIVSTYNRWFNEIDPLLESTRIACKNALNKSVTVEEIDQIVKKYGLEIEVINTTLTQTIITPTSTAIETLNAERQA